MPKLNISFKIKKIPITRTIFKWHLYSRLDLVCGIAGDRSRPRRLKRYLRVRDSKARVSYYKWNGDEKGERLRYLRNITYLKPLTVSEVEKHYEY